MKHCFNVGIFLYCFSLPSHGGEFDAKRHKMAEVIAADVAANEGFACLP
ncbi:MAG: hypothetical protein ABI167_03720 [Nitrosospira sp.]